MIQAVVIGTDYFTQPWNILDVGRAGTTAAWIVIHFFDTPPMPLSWLVLVLSFMKGINGFKAFDKTRFYVRLIFQSLDDIKFFLIIFVYTTLSFGALNVTTYEQPDYGFIYLWVVPFDLVSGESGNMNSEESDLRYFSFCLALVVNIVLMFNMIISILGDSFDAFQLKSEIIDYKEMAEVVQEIEQIKNLFRPADKDQYLSVCVNPYEDKAGGWGGKVFKTQLSIEQAQKKIEESIRNTGLVIDEKITEGIGAVGVKISEVREDFKILSNDIKSSGGGGTLGGGEYLGSDISEIKSQGREVNRSIEQLSGYFSGFEKRITDVEQDMGSVKNSLASLDQKLEIILSKLAN